MPLLETTIAGVGRLALAATFDGLAPISKARKTATIFPRNSAPEMSADLPKAPEAAIYAVAIAAWLSERKTLTRHHLDRDAKAAVTFKDIMMAGAVISAAAHSLGKEVVKRKHGNGSPDLSESGRYARYFTIGRLVNRVFVAGAIAATPLINFGLFNAYKPQPIRSLFRL